MPPHAVNQGNKGDSRKKRLPPWVRILFPHLQMLTAILHYGIVAEMIRSFACKETERIFNDETSRRFPPQIQRAARRKLLFLNDAGALNDLRFPYGNRLEALRGDRKGQFSIRVNDQWRICFRWQGADAFEVEIVDYH
jgi:proteic killer suppression protein